MLKLPLAKKVCKLTPQNCVDTLKENNLLIDFNSVSSVDLNSIHVDSRKIQTNDIFIAYKGVGSDGHEFIKSSLKSGCNLTVLEDERYIEHLNNENWILVKDARKAWSWLSATEFNHPQNSLNFIGITGTNGKTSSIWILKEILLQNNISFCSIGTLGIWINNEFYPSNHTTPDPDILYPLFGYLKSKGVKNVIMEVSSHSLIQGKLDPVKFNVVGFTSFSRDHLDFHPSISEYFDAKMLLFNKHLKKDGLGIVNKSVFSIHKKEFESLKTKLLIYGNGSSKEKKTIDVISEDKEPSSISIIENGCLKHKGDIPYRGFFNYENFCLSHTIARRFFHLTLDSMKMSDLNQIPGRLQMLASEGIEIYVDYAHTPDALKQVLSSLSETTKSITTIFGCGGDRDKGKRSQMAGIAENLSDHVIVTSDNPRNEDPHTIIMDICKGFKNKDSFSIVDDRKTAIVETIKKMDKNSILLIAGKGHENYQIIGDKVIDFDDFKIAKDALEKR